MHPYFDPLCPGVPDTGIASHAVISDLTSRLETAWPDRDFLPETLITVASYVAASPFLQRLAIRHSADIGPCLAGDAAQRFDSAQADFRAAMADVKTDAAAMATIRQWRGRSALIVALADLAGLALVSDQIRMLSDAADSALGETIGYLYRQAAQRGKLALPAADMRGCGWTVLALGKLGAGELNFSSDIDLIMLHDTARSPLATPDQTQPFFVGMTRDLIRLLGAATSDGIGWRVDLRLRPDPGATAVSIDIEAAIGYYESIARTWERAAFIRARPVAGDRNLGASFLQQIQPFIWRKTLDYTVMEDMKSMLRRPPQGHGWHGYNLKTGKNGIRQIEFFTHVLQLVTGGRDPALRHRQTIAALTELSARNWIEKDQASALAAAYFQLRRAEHRLQMIGDTQTHSLPRSDEDLLKFARFMGHPDIRAFTDALQSVLTLVGDKTRHDLLTATTGTDADDSADFTSLLDDYDALIGWLGDHGFARPRIVADTLSGWMAGRIAATRSDRARSLLNRLMPEILLQLTAASEPDDKFAALAQFIEGLPASVQIFSLLDYNRHLTKLLCDMLLLSPHLGNQLRHHPMLFDLLLYPSFFDPLPDSASLTRTLQDIAAAHDAEQALDAIKIQTREWKFRIQVQALSQTIDSDSLGRGLAAIAEATVATLLDLVRTDMTRRHGHIDGSVAVVALGRLGSGTMTVTSDLDLLVLFDTADGAMSDGAKPLGAISYFARLAQTLTSWLGTPTAEGVLYAVDLRLRPEGEAGGIATSLNRFTTYFATDAWLWEKLALTKARPVAGDKAFGTIITTTINQITNQPHAMSTIAAAIADMLNRLQTVRKPQSQWDLRAQQGGLTDLDLLIQGLRYGYGDLFTDTGQSQAEILDRLKAAEQVDDATYDTLSSASRLFGELHHCLRLTFGNAAKVPDPMPPPLASFILTRMDIATIDQLAIELDAARNAVTHLMKTALSPASPCPDIVTS